VKDGQDLIGVFLVDGNDPVGFLGSEGEAFLNDN
jgi:hypothetical protein